MWYQFPFVFWYSSCLAQIYKSDCFGFLAFVFSSNKLNSPLPFIGCRLSLQEFGLIVLSFLCVCVTSLLHFMWQVPMFTASGLRVRFLKVVFVFQNDIFKNLLQAPFNFDPLLAGVGKEWVQHCWMGSLHY